jgi:hypothetical protein
MSVRPSGRAADAPTTARPTRRRVDPGGVILRADSPTTPREARSGRERRRGTTRRRPRRAAPADKRDRRPRGSAENRVPASAIESTSNDQAAPGDSSPASTRDTRRYSPAAITSSGLSSSSSGTGLRIHTGTYAGSARRARRARRSTIDDNSANRSARTPDGERDPRSQARAVVSFVPVAPAMSAARDARPLERAPPQWRMRCALLRVDWQAPEKHHRNARRCSQMPGSPTPSQRASLTRWRSRHAN